MPTELLPTRSPRTEAPTGKLSRGLAFAIGLHALVFGGIILAAIVAAHSDRWGEHDPMAGAIQASVVNALPLPPRVPSVDHNVLASDHPSIAPTPPPPTPEAKARPEPAKPKAEPPPRPNEVLLPDKPPPKQTPKPAAHEQPTPDRRPVAHPPPTNKATTGDAPGMQIPESALQFKNGNASVSVEDRVFGDRYAYYIRIITQKVNQSKSEDPDGPDTRGKRASISFVIDRDGVPQDIQVATRSGSAALDQSTLRAIQRIDSFGPLPAGNRLPIVFNWDSK